MKILKPFFFLVLILSCSKDDNISPIKDFQPLQSAFGVDGLNQQYLNEIALLEDGISGINGISWDDIEPTAPQNGVHNYRLQNEMAELNNVLELAGRKLQLNFRLSSHWALDRDPATQVTNPEDGSSEDGIIGVKASYEQDLAAAIKYILTNLEVEALQIGSEAENEWLNADAYVNALSIIYQAAKEVQPDITIMIFGFNPANYFIQPQNFNQALVDAKLDFVALVIRKGEPWYDVFTFHASREFEAVIPTVNWIKSQMQLNGYTKPIWVDDMYSAPWLDPKFGTVSEKEIFTELLDANPQAIAAFDSMQADYMIKKIAACFIAGIEKVFVSTDVDFDAYYIPNWRYAGLIKSNGYLKPAYHNLKLLIEKIDHFESVNSLNNHLYEFNFTNKKSVYLYWNDEPNEAQDLASLNSTSYTVHEFAYKLDEMPTSSKVIDIANHIFGSNPTLIELTE